MKNWAYRPPAGSRPKTRPALKRGTAIQIARKADRIGKPLSPTLRDEVIGTQMPAAEPPKYDPAFDGWTLDEKIAFHEHGTVPERYRR